MKSQSGVGLLQFILIIIVLLILLGVSTYVVFQRNSTNYEQEQTNINSENIVDV